MIAACTWLLMFQLAGEIIVRGLTLPAPGPAVGMILLVAACTWRPSLAQDLRVAAGALTRHLMLLVLPATTALVTQLDRLTAEWLPILVAVIAGSALTMTVTALTLRQSLANCRKR